jgi:cysteinyl-tRNA synthetase
MWKARKLNIMQVLIAAIAAISIITTTGCGLDSRFSESVTPAVSSTAKGMSSPTPSTGKDMSSPTPSTGKDMPSPTPSTGKDISSPTPSTQNRIVRRPWTAIHNWANWINDPDLTQLGATNFELAVIDYSADGSAQKAFTSQQIDTLRHSTCQRRLLSYLSIGQAESYRGYWQQRWSPGSPAWLGSVDLNWAGNYWVQYWDPAWQQIIYRYIDAIIAAGFDGIYLDRVDAYQEAYAAGHEDDMVQFVTHIANYARTHSPLGNDFGIVVQNAEALAANHPQYVQTVTGIGREEVYVQATNNATSESDRTQTGRLLDLFHQNSQGKLVLTIDYADDANLIRSAYERSRAKGYIPYVAPVDLNRLQMNAGYGPTCSAF